MLRDPNRMNTLYSDSCIAAHVNQWTYQQGFPKPARNIMISSCFNFLETKIKTKGLSLKYVAQGLETYHLQNQQFKLTQGKYLLVNEHIPVVEATIHTANTWGMCIDIDTGLVADVLGQLIQPDQIDSVPELQRYFLTDDLFVKASTASEQLAKMLDKLISGIVRKTPPEEPVEMLYDLIAALFQDNREMIRSYYNLNVSRTVTRKELYRRTLLGKEILDSSWDQVPDMKTVASECFLSEFRFYRLFRECFGISPFQYLLRRKINKAVSLKEQQYSWTEIALKLNFTDLAAFSNAFKKIKGVPPSKY